MAARFIATGATISVQEPEMLFATRILDRGSAAVQRRQYDISIDGRFLIADMGDVLPTQPIRLIQNWEPRAAVQ
jgi:hypothetical protein